MKKILFGSLLILSMNSFSQNKILFDATKAEMAGNADWVIDADTHNINFTSTGSLVLSGGNESNPQRIPTFAQSGVTASTAETYWEGGLSAMAIDCVKQGYTVETLPYNGAITYGVTTNVQDLSNYKAFVIDEPNISFTASEKAAIINFVRNGGGLMMICDHTVSDRNNDGIDSPDAWNDLLTNNTVQANPFGIAFDLANVSGNSSAFAALTSTSPYYSILHGVMGNPNQVLWSSGTTMTLSTTANSSVKGIVYKSGSSTTGTTNVYAAAATYQSGKVFAMGDSSPFDDGTGDSNDTLYTGYTGDASGNHRLLIMNAMIWLMTPSTLNNNNFDIAEVNFVAYPNPTDNKQVNLSYSLSDNETATLSIYDALGRLVIEKINNETSIGRNNEVINLDNLQSGIYICKLSTDSFNKSIQFIVK